MHEAHAQRVRGAEALGRQEIPPRLPRADRFDDVGTDRCRNQPELRLGQCERRLGDGNRDVGCGNQSDAAAIRRAVHAGDRRLRQRMQRAQHRGERRRVVQVLLVAERRHALHPVEIGAGTEAATRARENHDADVAIVVECDERLRQLRNQRLVERVVDFGPVQRDRRDTVAHGERARRAGGPAFGREWLSHGKCSLS